VKETTYRVAYEHLRDGSVVAKMYVTLPDGSVKTFEASAHPDEVGSLWSGLKKLGKGIAHVARHVAASKLFKVVAIGLAAAIPFAGPAIAPALVAAAAATGVAGKLAHASLLHKHGHSDLATKMALEAHADAMKLTGGNKDAARKLLTDANRKRLNVEALAAKGPPAKPVPAAAKDPVSAARAGRVFSNSGAPVTADELQRAHAQGRIFWVAQ
jgi:hypothetical protein